MKTSQLHTKLKANVKKNYIYFFVMNMHMTSAVWMIYLAYRGLSLFEIGIMESVYHLSSFSMEIPTGAIADLYGRKTSRILGRFFTVISLTMMILAPNVIWFGISFFFSALGNNLESGAGEALVYDSMKEIGIEDEYMKVSGRQEIIFQIARIIALIVGGYLASIDYALAFRAGIIVATISTLYGFTFTEPTIGKVEKKESAYKTFIHQIKESVGVIRKDKRIGFLIISTEIFGTLVTTVYFYIQNYMKMSGRTEFQVGIVLAIAAFGGAIFAANTYRLEKRYSFRKLLTYLPLIGSVGFITLALGGMVEISMILIFIVESVLFIIISDYINKLIPSEQRATILSFQSMAFSFFMILVFPVIGSLGDAVNLLYAFRLIAVISVALLVWMVITIRRNKDIGVK